MSRRFAIVGTGFCGTRWAAKLLTELGHPCGHEEAFELAHAGRWEHLEGDASLYAAAFPELLVGVRILHLRRDPVAFARSVRSIYLWADRCPDRGEHAAHPTGAHLRSPLAGFLNQHTGGGILAAPTDELERSRRHWVLWNRKAAALEAAAGGYRLEPVEPLWLEPLKAAAVLSWLVGEDLDPAAVGRVMGRLGKVNAKRRAELTLEEARAAEAWEV